MEKKILMTTITHIIYVDGSSKEILNPAAEYAAAKARRK